MQWRQRKHCACYHTKRCLLPLTDINILRQHPKPYQTHSYINTLLYTKENINLMSFPLCKSPNAFYQIWSLLRDSARQHIKKSGKWPWRLHRKQNDKKAIIYSLLKSLWKKSNQWSWISEYLSYMYPTKYVFETFILNPSSSKTLACRGSWFSLHFAHYFWLFLKP